MLQQDKPEDFVIATRVQHSVREFVQRAAAELGILGWTAATSFDELVREMVQADYLSAQRDELVKKAGFQAFDHHE